MYIYIYIYILWFQNNSSKRFSQARVQSCFCCLGCTVTVPHRRNALFFNQRGCWCVFRGAVSFLRAPPPESGWDHAPTVSPSPAAMWSPDWQLSLRSWWESLSSSWSGACPLSHAVTAPCTYKLWWRCKERQRRQKERRGEDKEAELRKGTMESRLERWMWRQRQGQVWGWRDNYTKLGGKRWGIRPCQHFFHHIAWQVFMIISNTAFTSTRSKTTA